MRVLAILGLAALAVIVPPVAASADVQGTYSLTRTSAPPIPSASATWSLAGPLRAARSQAAASGLPVDQFLQDSDSRYVSATLTSADQTAEHGACDNGAGGGWTSHLSGVSDHRAIFEIRFATLNLLTGRGSVSAGVAPTAYSFGSAYRMFQPGLTTWTYTNTCPGWETSESSPVEVVSDDAPTMFTGFTAYHLMNVRLPLVRSNAAWHLDKTFQVPDGQDVPTDVGVHLTITGSPTSLNADCTIPTVRRLHPYTRASGARALLRRAGFPTVTLTRPRYSKAAPRGHFFVREGIGNTLDRCGATGLHLTRSKGWPF
jgi:hypothetical protein